MTNTDSDTNTPRELELLTCSAGDYAVSQGRKLEVYELMGIHTHNRMTSDGNDQECMIKRAKAKGCEVVVDLRSMYAGSWGYIFGTGLRLRKNDP